MSAIRRLVLGSCVACAAALRVGVTPTPPMRAAACARAPALLAVPEAHQRRTAVVHMQQQLDDQAKSFYEGYVETDPVTGESKALTLDEKEKLYLECLDAYYNEDGKQLLGNEEYEQLKLDLDFDGRCATAARTQRAPVARTGRPARVPRTVSRCAWPLATSTGFVPAPGDCAVGVRAGLLRCDCVPRAVAHS